jgi:hypothetical protein
MNHTILPTYFDLIKNRLKLSALWIHDHKIKPSQRYFLLAYNTFWLFYIFILYLPSELLYAVYCFHDMDAFLGALRDSGNHVCAIYKVANYFIKRKIIINIINTLTNHPCDYEDCHDFKPNEIIKKELKHVTAWINWLWFFGNANRLSMLLGSLYVFLFMGDQQYDVSGGEELYQQKLPVNIITPFGTETRGKYLFTLMYTIIPVTYLVWIIVSKFKTDLVCFTMKYF